MLETERHHYYKYQSDLVTLYLPAPGSKCIFVLGDAA